jgi:hypothetical protein
MKNNIYPVNGDSSMEYSYETLDDNMGNVYINDNVSNYDTDEDEYFDSHFTPPVELREIDYDILISEDDPPVNNFYCEKQLRLLPGSLQTSWERKKNYIVVADVAIYDFNSVTPIVPDDFLSLDLHYALKNQCYMMNIGMKAVHGIYENMIADYLRWCDANGNILRTGQEKFEIYQNRAETEKNLADAQPKSWQN